MEPEKRPTGENSPIGKNEAPLSSRSTQQQGPQGEPKKSTWKEHSNPLVRSIAKVGLWVWLVVLAVGLGLAFLVSFIAL